MLIFIEYKINIPLSYNFKKGSDFVNSAENMIENKIMVNGEYYVAPVYNSLISDNYKIKYFNIGEVGNGMYGLGIPEDLKIFCDSPKSSKSGER